MHKEVLELIEKHPDLIYNLTKDYRKVLLVEHFKQNPVEEYMYGYRKAALIYNKAAEWGIAEVRKMIQEICGLKEDNAGLQIQYAKNKGLIDRSVKTNHRKGFNQKNYVGHS